MLNYLLNFYSDAVKRVRVTDINLIEAGETERWGKRAKVFELIIALRAPRGAKVRGRYVIVPRVKREGKWVNYAPLVSPQIEIASILSFAPLYIETDFKSYIYVYGSIDRSSTSAVATINEPFILEIEVVTENKEFKGSLKRVKLQKLIKRYAKQTFSESKFRK